MGKLAYEGVTKGKTIVGYKSHEEFVKDLEVKLKESAFLNQATTFEDRNKIVYSAHKDFNDTTEEFLTKDNSFQDRLISSISQILSYKWTPLVFFITLIFNVCSIFWLLYRFY